MLIGNGPRTLLLYLGASSANRNVARNGLRGDQILTSSKPLSWSLV